MKKIITKGIDLSYCQRNVDYNKVKKAGYTFAMLKLANARDTGITIDEQFENHYKGCIKAGINVGVYVYSLVTSPEKARECAKQTISYIKNKIITYPVCFDVEYEPFNLTCGKAMNTELFKAFLSEIESAKYYACVYTCPGFVASYLNDKELQRYDHWIADCSPNGKLDYDGACGLWQFSIAGDESLDIMKIGAVPGVNGKCDVDYAFYDYPSRIKKFGCNGLSNKKTSNNTTTSTKLKVGDKVKIKKGSTAYNGAKLASFVFNTKYTVLENPVKDRVVIGINGKVTAAIKASNLTKS